VRLLTEWYAPAMGLSVDEAGFDAAWEEALAPMIARQNAFNATGGVTVLRDYHAENIMLLSGGLADQGLLDFQDALVGHPPMIWSACFRMRAATFRPKSRRR
jgi:aminoglycoside/choline kinase family phosphotransferase